MTRQIDPIALKHFKKALEIGECPYEAGGKSVRAFSATITGVQLSDLPEEKIGRRTVQTMVNTGKLNTLSLCSAIMAWGGMRPNHRDLAFNEEARGH